MQNWIRLRIDNLPITTLSTGHNNLHRTHAVLRADGFNENFIAEDIALTLVLLQHGFRSVLTDVIAFDAEPEHIFSFVRRQQRWAAQTIQAANGSWSAVPMSVRFQLFKLVWMYLGVFLYPMWALLAAWGATTGVTDLESIGHVRGVERGLPVGITMRTLAPLLLPLSMLALKTPILVAAGVRLSDFLVHVFFSWNVAFYSMFAMIAAASRGLVQADLRFDATDKRRRVVTLRAILGHQPLLVPFLGIVGLGLGQNIVAFVLALPWFCMLFLCQFVVYWSHDREPKVRSGSVPI